MSLLHDNTSPITGKNPEDWSRMIVESAPNGIIIAEKYGGIVLTRIYVTLSCFIEPNPGRRGLAKSKFRYANCGLGFDLKTATESLDTFFGKPVRNGSRETETGRIVRIEVRSITICGRDVPPISPQETRSSFIQSIDGGGYATV